MNYSSDQEDQDPFHKKYLRLEKIAEGTYGIVWKVRNTDNHQVLAMKVFKNVGNEGLPVSAVRQIHILKKIKSSYILPPLDLHIKPKTVSMVSQWKQLTLNKLTKHAAVSNLPAKEILFHILSAMSEIHSNFIIHRDLKPANIVLDSLSPDAMHLKIIDFGMAKEAKWNKSVPMTNEVGTMYYRAPELLEGETRYSYEIDVWAVGCIFFQILAGEVLFKAENQAMQLIKIYEDLATNEQAAELISHHKEQILEISLNNWTRISEILGKRPHIEEELDLLKKMLKINPKKRLTCSEALLHPYFKL